MDQDTFGKMAICPKVDLKLIRESIMICPIQYNEAAFPWKVDLKILN